MRNTVEEFWGRAERTDSCWIWQRGKSGDGYGRFCLNGTNHSTHTLAYKLHNDLSLDSKVFVCHTCDNKLCINPEHLYNGNHKTNSQDMMERGLGKGQFTRDTPTSFKKGHIPASRKINEQTAYSVKKDLLSLRQCDVIRKYNLNRDTVRAIARGDSWASLEVAL